MCLAFNSAIMSVTNTPRAYCSALIRNRAMRGALAGLGDAGIPDSIVLLNVIKIKPLKKIKKA